MNRYKHRNTTIRNVSHALGMRGSSQPDVRALLAILDGPCECTCHHSGRREHAKGACKCRVVVPRR